MRFSLKTTACALAVSDVAVGGRQCRKDKTYAITILHTNDHHGHFWQNDHGEYGTGAQKRWWTAFVRRWRHRAATCCCCRAAISTPACRNRICRTPSRTSAA